MTSAPTGARAARDGQPARDGKSARDPAPPPEPLPGAALDSHCHLDLIERPVPEVLAEARQAGIRRLITVGVDLPTSRWSAERASEHEDLYAAVAVHPNETAAAQSSAAGRDAVLAELAALAGHPRVRAVGETGLDYYRDHSEPGIQRDWFRAHIEIAKRSGKALMIHDRDAHEDVLRILDTEGPPPTVVFHCFAGDAAMAKRCADAGYVMSFAGNVTFKNAETLREAAAVAPLESLLVETDAPFLTPVPNRGKPNAPAQVAHTVRFLAGLKQVSVAQMCGAVTANAERVFGPW